MAISACAHSQACQRPDLEPIAIEAAALPDHLDLLEVLEMFFDSHCTCVLSASFKSRVTYGAGRVGATEDDHGDGCLGAVKIVNMNLSEAPIVWFEIEPVTLRQATPENQLFLVTAVHTGDRWLVYPAEAVLDSLH